MGSFVAMHESLHCVAKGDNSSTDNRIFKLNTCVADNPSIMSLFHHGHTELIPGVGRRLWLGVAQVNYFVAWFASLDPER